MAKSNEESQGQILERVRGELGMTKVEFCEKLGVSRPWYDRWVEDRDVDLATLVQWVVDFEGEPVGEMAIRLLYLHDYERFIPCTCQTMAGDVATCPKHTVRMAVTI